MSSTDRGFISGANAAQPHIEPADDQPMRPLDGGKTTSLHGNQSDGFKYGAAAAEPHVELTDADALRPTQGVEAVRGTSSSVFDKVKEALKPGDLKAREEAGGSGVLHAVQSGLGQGRRDERMGQNVGGSVFDKAASSTSNATSSQSHRDASGQKGVLDSLMPGTQSHVDRESIGSGTGGSGDGGILSKMVSGLTGSGNSGSSGADDSGAAYSTRSYAGTGASTGTKQSGLGERTADNYTYDKFPTGDNKYSSGAGATDSTAPRVSTLDSKGSIGHQFTSEGAIGGTADKVGGPFSKDGSVGQHFRDDGAIGGAVQDKLGHGDATRRGV